MECELATLPWQGSMTGSLWLVLGGLKTSNRMHWTPWSGEFSGFTLLMGSQGLCSPFTCHVAGLLDILSSVLWLVSLVGQVIFSNKWDYELFFLSGTVEEAALKLVNFFIFLTLANQWPKFPGPTGSTVFHMQTIGFTYPFLSLSIAG